MFIIRRIIHCKKLPIERGFTLAELVICIAVIGVIAAITIGGSYGGFCKSQHAAECKVAYKTLQNAIGKKVQEVKSSDFVTVATWYRDKARKHCTTIGRGSGTNSVTKINKTSPWIITEGGIAFGVESHMLDGHSKTDLEYMSDMMV